MNKDEFIKVVNMMIDARIKKIVPALVRKEIKELKRELEEGTSDLPENIKIPDLNSVLNEDVIISKGQPKGDMLNRPEPVKPSRHYTKDPKLNALLQQTEQEIRSGKTQPVNDIDSMEQYKRILAEQYAAHEASGEDMETFNFTSVNIQDIMNGMMPVTKAPTVTKKIQDKVALEVEKKQIEAMTNSPEIAGAIMRDYRDFMKTVEEKSKNPKIKRPV